MKNLKLIFLLFLYHLLLMIWVPPAAGQVAEIRAEEIPADDTYLGARWSAGTRTVGDFLFDVDIQAPTGDIRCLGVENVSGLHDWWVTGAADMQGGYLYQLSYDGQLLWRYSQGNSAGWGWRDLAYDGDYLYASDSYFIEQISVQNGSVTGLKINSPISPARALAYDPVTDSFWTASYDSPIYNVFWNGSHQTYDNPNSLSIYGMAMDPVNDILWTWSQDASGALASAFNPRTGIFTGESWDGKTAPFSGDAGGSCIFQDPTHGTVFAGLHQSNPDNVAVYEISLNPFPQLDIKCNGQESEVVVADVQKVTLTIGVEARQGAGKSIDVWCILNRKGTGTYTYDGTTWNKDHDSVYFSGGLNDMFDTILDETLPVGSYIAYLGIDTKPNGLLDMDSIFDYDAVDFEVVAMVGISEDFEDGFADNWVDDGPHWSVNLGTYLLDTPSFAHYSSYYDFDYCDFTYEIDMRMVDTGNINDYYYYGLYFRSDGTIDNCYTLYTMNSGSCFLHKIVNGVAAGLYNGSFKNFVTGVGSWNTLGVDVRGSGFDVYCNGVMEFSVTDTTYISGKVGLRGEGSLVYDLDYEFDNIDLNL